MMNRFKDLLIWLKHNERHLWTVLFVGGFTTDVITFLPAPLSIANILFIVYLAIVIAGTLGAHYCFVRNFDQKKSIGARVMNVGFPFLGEFFTGALLSGLLIFYTKSSALIVSWPFILFLFAIFLGNELFRGYRKHLPFQTTLVFFTIYAYAIFSLPLALGHIGPDVFLESGALSISIFALFVLFLSWIGWKRLKESLVGIIGGGIALIVVVNTAYFTGLIPPLPLTLTDAGAYQSITHSGMTYQLSGEPAKPWWDVLEPQVVHLAPGESLSFFSSVYAPVAFSSTIVHRWEEYDTTKKAWVTRAVIAFSITGGREMGYRGYSTITNVDPGQYRVTVETLSGQSVGRESFTVVAVPQAPAFVTTTK